MANPTLEQRMQALRREVAAAARPLPAEDAKPRPASRRSAWSTMALAVAKLGVVVALPFVLYARASVALYQDAGLSPWAAVAVAALFTLGVAAAYAS